MKTGNYSSGSSGALTKVFWNDEPLKASARAAFKDAVKATQTEAAANADWSANKRAVRGVVRTETFAAVYVAGNLGHLEEWGTKEHDIYAGFREDSKAQAMTVGDKFYTKVHVSGIKEHPFLRPAAAHFPSYYQVAARRRLASGVATGLSGGFRGLI